MIDFFITIFDILSSTKLLKNSSCSEKLAKCEKGLTNVCRDFRSRAMQRCYNLVESDIEKC